MSPARLFFLFLGTVFGPALAVWIFNNRVFPESALAATIMLGICVLIAATFTWRSRKATKKTQAYCLWAHVAISASLCVNLGGHWLLAREVAAAKQGVVERHAEEDRQDERRAKEHTREMESAKAEADLIERERRRANAEAWRLSQLPRDQRQSALRPSPRTSAPPAEAPAQVAEMTGGAGKAPAETPARKLTPEEVVEKWIMFLTIMAFVDCFMSVGAGAMLGVVWEWDRNNNGIPDHLEGQIHDAISGALAHMWQAPQAPARSTVQAPVVQPTRPLVNANAPTAPVPSNGVHRSNGAPLGKARAQWWKVWRR